ncbi:hypothetical protein B0H10DRAFT_1947118 [Mycena sp. CBHHK59/15]|nr:hypothetical protein B0H10DRAFT_1951815 [Mycena sp. CBHHK59/15]KAJ6619112.1 hypothetical protein B0H10DRAFT_1947118 [Mycena sp. CBHHK59/15]
MKTRLAPDFHHLPSNARIRRSGAIDVLVLSLYDIETVLLMGRGNSFGLSSLKKFRRTNCDCAHTRYLADHSVEELIALVKRTVPGPATWSVPNTSSEESSLPDVLLEAEYLQLLPGGRGSVTVIQVKFETGESKDLFDTQLPNKLQTEGGVLALSGDLLTHAVFWADDTVKYGAIYAILLVDWRLQQYI